MEKYKKINKQNAQARGVEPADYVLKNCRVINVYCGEIVTADIAMCGDTIVGVGDYSGVEEIDCQGSFVSPGFIEGHIHIESSMLSPRQFVETVLPHGTTSVICDPHEIANVAGIAGVKYMLEESQNLPCSIFVMAPSCVPATHLENSGAVLRAADMDLLLQLPNVIGVAEMMNYPGVLFQDEEVLEKLELAKKRRVHVDGHAPGLSGKDLQAYIGNGILSDHECSTAAEAYEKLLAGMYLFIREGSTAKNLEALLPAVTEKNSHRCLLVTDDCHPDELLNDGHLDRILRKAITLGLDPITAIQMVTINAANYFGLSGRGAIAPGCRADLVLFDDLHDIKVKTVYSGGKQVTDNMFSNLHVKKDISARYPTVFDSVHVDLEKLSFKIIPESKIARVISVQKDELITESIELPIPIEDGLAVTDIERDILKLAVVERHHATGNIGLGFVQGVGLKTGAIASTVGHDSHNITVIGTNDEDMDLVVRTIVKQGGGLAIVNKGKVVAKLVLEVAGLMSTAEASELAKKFALLLNASKRQGVVVDDPFMLMSFLALPVIPHLKMTDMGLVDVDSFCFTDLWV